MKTLGMILGILSFCTLPVLTGCSDLSISDGNMENIFSSRRDDVLMPKEIVYDSRSFTEYSTALQFIYGTLREYRYGYYDDVAAVYNDTFIVVEGWTLTKGNALMPHIDYNHYSMVICKVWLPAGNYYVTDQRIVCDKNKYTLCLKVEADKDIVCMDDPEPVYLAAVYPKLETGRIGVFCWNNY